MTFPGAEVNDLKWPFPMVQDVPPTNDSIVAAGSEDHLRCSTKHLMTAVSLHFITICMTMASATGGMAPQLLGNETKKEQKHSKPRNIFKYRMS